MTAQTNKRGLTTMANATAGSGGGGGGGAASATFFRYKYVCEQRWHVVIRSAANEERSMTETKKKRTSLAQRVIRFIFMRGDERFVTC